MPDPMRRWRKAATRGAGSLRIREHISPQWGGIKKHTAIVFASPVSLQLQDSVNARDSSSLGASGMNLECLCTDWNRLVESLEFLISNPKKFLGQKCRELNVLKEI